MLPPSADPLSPTVAAWMRALGRARAALIRATGVPVPVAAWMHPAYAAVIAVANAEVAAGGAAADPQAGAEGRSAAE